jgi:hypothetical protein
MISWWSLDLRVFFIINYLKLAVTEKGGIIAKDRCLFNMSHFRTYTFHILLMWLYWPEWRSQLCDRGGGSISHRVCFLVHKCTCTVHLGTWETRGAIQRRHMSGILTGYLLFLRLSSFICVLWVVFTCLMLRNHSKLSNSMSGWVYFHEYRCVCWYFYSV